MFHNLLVPVSSQNESCRLVHWSLCRSPLIEINHWPIIYLPKRTETRLHSHQTLRRRLRFDCVWNRVQEGVEVSTTTFSFLVLAHFKSLLLMVKTICPIIEDLCWQVAQLQVHNAGFWNCLNKFFECESSSLSGFSISKRCYLGTFSEYFT